MNKSVAMAVACAAAAIMVVGCVSNDSGGGAPSGDDAFAKWTATRTDASKAFASKCTVGSVATMINAVGAPLQLMQRQAYDKADQAFSQANGRRIWFGVDNDVKGGAKREEVLAKLSAEDKAKYDAYQKYVVDQDFGERENLLKAMLPKLAQAGVEIGGLVVAAKKDPDFAKLAGLAMAMQVKNVNKDVDELKKILDDTNKATEFWKLIDNRDKAIQKDAQELEKGFK